MNPEAKQALAGYVRSAAVHEGGHAVVAAERRRTAQIVIDPNITDLTPHGHVDAFAHCVRGLGGRKAGVIENAAYGLAGYCAEFVFEHAFDDFDSDLSAIAFWVGEVRRSMHTADAMSATDRKMWQHVRPQELTKALKEAVRVVLVRHADIERIVRIAEAQFGRSGYVRLNWPPGPFDHVEADAASARPE
jgi:hypothetical protein